MLANAVTYGEPPIRLSLWAGRDELCVRVTDHGYEQPRHLDLGVEAIHGRGLTIVAALTDDYGITGHLTDRAKRSGPGGASRAKPPNSLTRERLTVRSTAVSMGGMNEIAVREIRPGDGEGCARAWTDAGRYYAAVVPEVIQEPDPDGLVEWFERAISENRGDDTLRLVATVGEGAGGGGGRVVGMIEATVRWPHPDGRFQLQRDQSRTRLVINALAVTDDYRRQGVGTALMRAAEEWGRDKGAVVALTDTNLRSSLSVPFYEDRMGYLRQAVILRKTLRHHD